MRPEFRRNVTRGMFFALAVLFVGALAGCEEDTKATNLPPGEGTIESPYVIQHGLQYAKIPMPVGGSVFFVAQNVPAGFSTMTTDSTTDVDLQVHGFQNLFQSQNRWESTTPANGHEEFAALGDGTSTDLFFMVDGTHVRADDATIDVSVMAAASGPTVTVNPAAFFSAIVWIPDLFPMADAAPLSATLSNTTAQFLYYYVFDIQGFFMASGAGDASGYNAWYGGGYCTVNYDFTIDFPFTSPNSSSTTKCKINPISGYASAEELQVYNATAFPATATLTFTSP